MEKKISKKALWGGVFASIIVLLIGASYALWIILREQDTENRITSSCISIELENVTEEISLSNAN